jgi:phage repressor protein C with HTH and peptisase S24 domain
MDKIEREALLMRISSELNIKNARGWKKGVADAFGIADNTLSTWIKRGIPDGKVEKLCLEKGLNYKKIVNGCDTELVSEGRNTSYDSTVTHPSDCVYLPRYSVEAAAGDGRTIQSEQIIDSMAFRKTWITSRGIDPKRACLIRALGDSMEPTIASGAMVLVDLSRNLVQSDGIYVFRTDGDLRIKRMQRMMNGNIRVRSDNPEYQEEIVSPEDKHCFEIVGKAVWVGVEL